ncbi:MAG: 5'/3'-nucleotidase SurE [Chloroflexi bacterium]|jgi:5'-nucleotidase|nr:5'/3'-nucleotidase SurE [Chloroflexota bacterium]
MSAPGNPHGGRRPLLLVSNDDGVFAPSLPALRAALEPVGEVAIVAPEHNWSAAGHTKTLHKPLRVNEVLLADGHTALAASGSPSDCVALAMLGIVERRPDLVISGINRGANVGYDLTYSGTVAAAMEAVIWGVAAIAISLAAYEPETYEVAARFAAFLAERLLREERPYPLLLNVNVPAAEEIREVRVTRLGQRIYRDALVKRLDPRGRPYYWIGGEPPSGHPEPGTDIGALADGCISVTPVRLDMTDHDQVARLASWDWQGALP